MPSSIETPPPVELGQELRYWFQSAQIRETLPSHYSLELKLAPDYQARLSKHQLSVRLAFDYWSHTRALYRGQVPCIIHPEEAIVRVDLPNPERISARQIHLRLAH
jgi:hypothetical protein